MVDIVHYFYHVDIPNDDAETWARARLALLDSLGCAVASYSSSAQCRAIVGPTVSGSSIPHGVHLPGTRYVLDPLKAAFDLGTMIRYLDHNDGYPGLEWGHPSDVLGAILAVADWQTRRAMAGDGGRRVRLKTILEATIKAYEVHCLFQHANSLNRKGYDHTILVKVAAVVAVSWLLGMREDQALAALSHVYMDGGLLRIYRQAPNTGPRKGWAAGDACMRAVHLALLVRAGQPGAPTVLSDPRWGFAAVLLGGRPFQLPFPYGTFAIRHSFFKLVAAEGHGISACHAAAALAAQLRQRGVADQSQRIVGLRIRTMKPAIAIIDKQGPLRNYADRDHCLSYMVAVVLLKGQLPRAEDYHDDSPFARDPRVDRLRRATSAYEDPRLTADYYNPAKRTGAAGLTATLDDGEVLPEVLVEAPLGHSSHPETPAAVVAKLRENLAAAGFAPASADRALEATEQDDYSVSDLMDIFWKGHGHGRL